MKPLYLALLITLLPSSALALIPGCGNTLIYDGTDCGPSATTLYTSIDPAITISNGIQITGCNFTFTSNNNYFLGGNIGSDQTINCLTVTGLSNVNIDLKTFTVTGLLQLNTNQGRNQNIHIYNGGINCNKSGGSASNLVCLGLNNNQVTTINGAFKFHHLTIQNFFDSGTNNLTSTGTPFAVGGDLGHNSLTGDTYELYFQYNSVIMTNNNYASGRTGAVQIIGGLAPLKFSNNIITIGGGEATSQGIVCYGCVGGSQINNNIANLALTLYNSLQFPSRAFMFDASQGTLINPLEAAFNDVITNDHRCLRARDSDYPYFHDNYCRTIRYGGVIGANATLGAVHMGDPNSFPSSAIVSDVCGPNATLPDGCVITLNGNQNWVGHEGDLLTISTATPSTLQETVAVTTGNPSTPNVIKYASNNPANNNVTSSGAIAFVYSNTMNAVISNNTFQVDCSVNKQGIIIADRATNGNLFSGNTVTSNGDCTTGFTGALFKRYLNAARDTFTIRGTSFLNQLGGANYPLLTTSNGPSVALQQFGIYCSTLGPNGITDGDPGWLLFCSVPMGVSGAGSVSGAGVVKNP